jgi:ribosomal protein S18 acetylase RimI-like enzyme
MNEIDIDRDICIRPCRAEDMSIAHKIDKTSIPAKVSLEWLNERRKENPDLFYVACDSHGGAGALGDAIDGVVGYVSGAPYERDNLYGNPPGGYISRLAVTPNYRKQGVGTVLVSAIEYALALYRKSTVVYVETQKSNEGAIKFYTSMGFVRNPELDNEVGYMEFEDPDDTYVVVMSKPLLSPNQYRFNVCVFVDGK